MYADEDLMGLVSTGDYEALMQEMEAAGIKVKPHTKVSNKSSKFQQQHPKQSEVLHFHTKKMVKSRKWLKEIYIYVYV